MRGRNSGWRWGRGLTRRSVLHALAAAATVAVPAWADMTPVEGQAAAAQAIAVSSMTRTELPHAPVVFEANQGQAEAAAAFLQRGAASTLLLEHDRLTVSIGAPPHPTTHYKPADHIPKGIADPPSGGSPARTSLSLLFVGANPTATITGVDRQPGVVNYFVGRDPGAWHRGIPTFSRVMYRDLYPHIDLVVYAGAGEMPEYDWVVHPGGNPAVIQVRVEGADSVTLDRHGALQLATALGTLSVTQPLAYQQGASSRRSVASSWTLQASGVAAVRLGPHDSLHDLVIDPVIVFSTYVGASTNMQPDAVAVNALGGAYIVGTTSYQETVTGPAWDWSGNDVSVTALTPDGSSAVYTDYIGGSRYDDGAGIAVDTSGDVYLTGFTASADFPTVQAVQATLTGTQDAFVASLSPDGSTLRYSTYLGGSAGAAATGIALDSSHDAFVAGWTTGSGFPTANPIQAFAGGADAFVAELDSSGSHLVYSTYVGGSGTDQANAIAVDSSGEAVIAGFTGSSDFPTTPSTLQSSYGWHGSGTGFVAKLVASGTSLVASTFLGGTWYDEMDGVALDAQGDVYATGYTESSDYPVLNAYQATYSNIDDAVVSKLTSDFATLVYSTYLGGAQEQQRGAAIAVDASGGAIVVGYADSNDFPQKDAFPVPGNTGFFGNAFASHFDASGGLLYSTFLGGSKGDEAYGVAVDGSGDEYVVGRTCSVDFPVENPYQSSTASGYCPGFATKISPSDTVQPSTIGGPVSRPNFCYSCWVKQMQTLQNEVGDPVDTATGALTEEVTDLSITGRGLPLALARAYTSSDAAANGPMGYGWSSTLSVNLSTLSSGNVSIAQEDGSAVTFVPDGSGGYRPQAPRFIATLQHNADGSWSLTRQARLTVTFDSTGRLVAEQDLNGYVTSFGYNAAGQMQSITDSAGRSLTLGYSASHLATMTDPIGRTVQYGYNDGAGNLTDVTDVNGGVTHYSYTSGHLLHSRTDPRGGVVVNSYDAQERVVSQSDALQRLTTLAYSGDPMSDAGGTVTVTDPKGNVMVDGYQDGLRVTETLGSGTAQAATWRYVYDPATLALLYTTDPNGHVTHQSYDANGNPVERVDALGRQTTWSYDNLGDVIDTVDPTGNETSASYDGAGNLLQSSTSCSGCPGGPTFSTTDTYGDPSHPGDLTAVTDPAGKTWQYAYDQNGDLTNATDPLGDTSTTRYNAVGWKVSSVSARGNVAGCGCAAEYTTTYSYNDPTTNALDGFGDVRTVTDPLGATTTLSYDGDREVVRQTDGNSHTTQFTYDLDGELTDTTRADGSVLHTDYFLDGRVKDQVDAGGHSTMYADDPLGRATSVTTSPTSACPSGCTTAYTYDGAGNRLTMTDPLSQTTTYGYDSDNELVSMTYSDGSTPAVSAVGYDADGRRTSMTDGTGTSTWTYDPVGRLTASRNGAGQSVAYAYDPRGLLTSLTYPNSQLVARGYDDAGRLTSVTDWLGKVSTFGYDAEGALTSESYPNHIATTMSHDADGRVSAITDNPQSGPALASFSYGRDATGQVTSETDSGTAAASASYHYTALDQLSSANGSPYSYDAGDNPVAVADTGRVLTYDAADEATAGYSTITLVGTNSANGTPGGGSVTVSLPAGVAANDQIIVAATEQTGSSVTTPTGYHPVSTVSSGGLSGATTSVWQRTATGPETSITIPYSGLSAVAVVVAVYRGVDPSAPVDGKSTGSSQNASTVTAASVTTTLPSDRLVLIGGAASYVAPASWAPPPNMALETSATTPAVVSSALADGAQAQAGASGTETAALSTSLGMAAALVALKPAPLSTYTFDARGDRVAAVATGGATTASYGFDQAGRLTQLSYAGTTHTYAYDGSGLRSSTAQVVGGTPTTTAHFAWDASSSVPLLLSDGSTSYIYGPAGPLEQVGSSGAIAYYHQDQLGSTRMLTDTSGAVVASFAYGPYGNLATSTGSVTTPLLYAGQYRDAESGLYYMRARYYDPTTAQFLSRDPLEVLTRAPYGYVGDNPLNATDPLGLEETPNSVQRTIDRIEGQIKNIMEDERGLYQQALEGDEGCIEQMRRHVERIKQEQTKLQRDLGRIQEGDLTEAELGHAQYQLGIDPYADLLPPEWAPPPPPEPRVPPPVDAGGGGGGGGMSWAPGEFGGGHDTDN